MTEDGKLVVISGHWHTATVNRLVRSGEATTALVSTWMGDRNSMSISVDSPSGETLNCSCGDSICFGINIVQFSIFSRVNERKETSSLFFSVPAER